MALNNFLNQTANITSKVISIVWGEEQVSFSPVYTWIPCYYYKASQRLNETNQALNTNLSSYKVMLEANRVNVRENMIIEIIDPDLWNLWKFLIEWVKVNRLIDWTKDSIELNIKKYD